MILWFHEINNYDFQKTKLPKSHHRDRVVGKNKFELSIIVRQLRKGLKTLDNKTLYTLRLCVHENCEANQLFAKIQYHLTFVWAADVIKRPDYSKILLKKAAYPDDNTPQKFTYNEWDFEYKGKFNQKSQELFFNSYDLYCF